MNLEDVAQQNHAFCVDKYYWEDVLILRKVMQNGTQQ